MIETRCRTAVGEKEQLEEKLREVEREKKAGEKKNAQLQTKLTKATTELKEEKEVRSSPPVNDDIVSLVP